MSREWAPALTLVGFVLTYAGLAFGKVPGLEIQNWVD